MIFASYIMFWLFKSLLKQVQGFKGCFARLFIHAFSPAHMALLITQICPGRSRNNLSILQDMFSSQITLPSLHVFTGAVPRKPDLAPQQGLYLRFLLVFWRVLRRVAACGRLAS